MTKEVVPIGALFERVERRGRPDLPLLSVYRELGVVPREGREDNNNRPGDDLDAYKVVEPGDLVLNKMKTWQGSLGVSTHHGIVSPAYFVGRPRRTFDLRFVHHLLRSQPLIAEYAARSKGIRPSQWDLPWDEFKIIKIELPPIEEQRAIADYLDAETARIDALIAKKQRLIHLLDERLQGVSDEIVEDLSSRHRLVPLKRVVRESDRRLGPGQATEVLSVSIHHGVVPRSAIDDRESRADDFSLYKVCKPGEIALNRMRAFQGGVGVARTEGIVSPDYTVMTPSRAVLPGYLHFLMRSHWFVGEMVRLLRGIGSIDQGAVRTPRVNFADLGMIEIPIPPLDEQQQVSLALHSSTVIAQAARDLLRRQLELISEHRQALIGTAIADV